MDYELIVDGVSRRICDSLELARGIAEELCDAGEAAEIVRGNPIVGYEHVEYVG